MQRKEERKLLSESKKRRRPRGLDSVLGQGKTIGRRARDILGCLYRVLPRNSGFKRPNQRDAGAIEP